jgi:hypothetical protein
VAVNFGMGQWGEEVFLSLARAAVELEEQNKKLHSAGQKLDEIDWYERQQERIHAAERVQSMLSGNERAALGKHIAGLRSALKKGPKGLKLAGAKAAATRNRSARIRKEKMPRATDRTNESAS